jgi:Cu+-exporting ATPase
LENTPIDVELAVKGMHCASCAARLERTLSARSEVLSASVNLVTERAQLRVVPGTTLESLCDAIAGAGFEGKTLPKSGRLSLGADEEAEFARAARRDGWLLLASALWSFPLLLPMLLMPFGVHLHLSPWVELALATPVQFWLGARFYLGGYKAARHGSGNMDSLVALGTSAAYFYSLALVLSGPEHAQGALYFEASAVVITLVRLGKWFEAKAKRGTTAALRQLVALQPERVLLRRTERVADETVTVDEEVPLEQIGAGSIIVVRPGDHLAADGIVLEGAAAVDESMVTGESEPVTRNVGDTVVCGSLNTNGLLVVQVTEVGENSTLGKIIQLVCGAQAGKANIQRLVDQVSAVFVPIVLGIALVTFAAWMLVTGQFSDALVAAVSVLVIACPCALGLATPTAIVVGTGAAARAGILIRDVDTLERMSHVDTVVFDKTGTLTVGHPVVERLFVRHGDEERLLKFAASVEAPSLHPLAQAIVHAAEGRALPLLKIQSFESHTGQGVSAVIDGQTVRVGSLEWLGQCGVITEPDEAQSVASHVEVALDTQHLGTIYLADPARPTTADGLRALTERAIRSMVLSGDQTAAVERFARAVGLDEAFGRVRPAEKLERVRALAGDGRKVAMVGDGINDAPALAEAYVGIAMGTGTQVAVQTADVVLMRPDLRLVAASLDVAQATFAKIRQNLFWAFIYNCIGIPLAATGHLSPMVAGLAMALSSVSVVTNSLLLRGWRPRPGGLASRVP